ncbi:CLUMA_CG005066, isoform A [Clunio marinus]|uniref:CLUMA_CG005066, isoform A n=1 Tax=Clunio marinus TaxID=568069 RepID=A0A1J1HZ44_9DIPT|nr:CLUMA_CG005066, isoform A [Clunio marinus]
MTHKESYLNRNIRLESDSFTKKRLLLSTLSMQCSFMPLFDLPINELREEIFITFREFFEGYPKELLSFRLALRLFI